MNLKNYNGKKPKKILADDEEFLGKLNKVIESCTKSFEAYEFSKAKQEIEKFFWEDFCNTYLESVKKVVYQGEGEKKLSAEYTLYRALLTTLKLFAPFVPFITEEVYQTYFKNNEKDKSIHISEWPKKGAEKDKGDWETFKEILSLVNQQKSKNKLPLNSPIASLTLSVKNYNIIKNYEERFKAVSGVGLLKKGKNFEISIK